MSGGGGGSLSHITMSDELLFAFIVVMGYQEWFIAKLVYSPTWSIPIWSTHPLGLYQFGLLTHLVYHCMPA